MFGGYTDLKFNYPGYTSGNKNSFLFSFTKNTKHKCIRGDTEIAGGSGYYFAFGYGHDLLIHSLYNYSYLGYSYELP